MKKFCFHILLCLFQVVACCVVFSCRPPAATTKDVTEIQKDSVHEKITERLVPYPVPGETVTVKEYIECDSITNKPKPIRGSARNGRSETNYSLDKDGNLLIRNKCDSLELMLKERDREITQLKQSTRAETKTETVIQFQAHWYDIAARWIAAITLLFILYRLRKLLPL